MKKRDVLKRCLMLYLTIAFCILLIPLIVSMKGGKDTQPEAVRKFTLSPIARLGTEQRVKVTTPSPHHPTVEVQEKVNATLPFISYVSVSTPTPNLVKSPTPIPISVPSPTPTPHPTPTPTRVPSPTPSPDPSPIATPSPDPTPVPSPTPDPTPSPIPTPH